MDKQQSRSGGEPGTFGEILQEMNREGGFSRSVLATSEGLSIASAPMDPDHDLASAMIAMLQKVGVETQDQLDLAPVDEVTIRTEKSEHLVCRTITYGGDWVCLCAVVPPGQAYRRATNRAVRRIQLMLE
jgi:predicted regulator of Ras-like GTPase activity (Roadblock/LC7/MglB family)